MLLIVSIVSVASHDGPPLVSKTCKYVATRTLATPTATRVLCLRKELQQGQE